MQIHITKECIFKGTPQSASSCPIALALKSIFPNRSITVTKWIGLNHRYCIDHTEETHRFMSDFDDGKPVQPFSFRLAAEALIP